MIAVRPDPLYIEEHPDEPAASFWLAKIKGIKQNRGNYFYRVGWFFNENFMDLSKSAIYVYDADSTQIIPYTSILHHEIELTPERRLRTQDARIINLKLNE